MLAVDVPNAARWIAPAAVAVQAVDSEISPALESSALEVLELETLDSATAARSG